MDETKNAPETEASRAAGAAASASSDETRSLSGTAGSQPPIEGSSDSSDRDPPKIGRYRIIRRLGQGGFGRVYLAHDDDLDRAVAIKVPSPERISHSEDLEAFLIEAKVLAKLDHPHIVPVFDVGRTEDGLCFVVSKLIEGSDLAVKMDQARPSFRDSAELVATIADALHYAHTRGLVHRDIKPANILIDTSGKPCVADFGLALKDEDFGKGGGLAGTPAYMSPEQARGEGHRVDGRSDIFSLGVVFYELLTGKRPFRGDSLPNVIQSIIIDEPRPPRQIDDTIPKELERICQKALAKRASERYSTAKDLAEDLRLFLQTTGGTASPGAPSVPTSIPPASTLESAPLPATSRQSDSNVRPIKIVPRGLRSFDEHDADYFLELLPGPRDRDGLPDSIQFWKRKIEQIDPDLTFKVGLIYGPSGCGKSSLMKAGLLPRLGKHVLPVYIESTPEETEARLLKGLRKVCPELSRELALVDSLASMRRGRVLPPERKVLLVLDQFEQWLHAKRGQENTELVAALRQCDGEHVQAIVMVRDDFWLAASRFMGDLEVDLVPDRNIALVDLFDPRHAKKVLTLFGQAYGALPEKSSDLSREVHSFLDLAIEELIEAGKIVSVRLALFAEMVKAKVWSPTTLREIGGTEGVGVTFLEETFGSAQANPKHRLHQQAAQAVLRALLPESGTDLKGRMRSRQELLEASGYENRPRDFDDLIHILDPELRLITPTDPEGVASGEWRVAGENEGVAGGGGSIPTTRHSPLATRYYQLAHDYLVHSLRAWLTRKHRETRRGRAELRLAERSSLWNSKPENRHLPSAMEWLNIRLLTKKRDWTEPQSKMMRAVTKYYAVRATAAVVLLVFTGWFVFETLMSFNARNLVDVLRNAETKDAAIFLPAMTLYERWANPMLRTMILESREDSKEHLHASLALLPADPSQVDYLFKRLLSAKPDEFPVLRDALKTHSTRLAPKLWTVLESAKPSDVSLLPAASALASYAPDDGKWEAEGGKVAQALVSVDAILLGPWIEALRPVRAKLTVPLATIFQDKERPESEHKLATNILANYASDNPDRLAELLMVADPKAYVSLFPVAEKRSEQVLPVLQVELAKNATYSWNDLPLDPSGSEPDSAIVRRIEAAQGILAKRFAFCQTMPLDEFLATAEALRESGYRPVRFRPYADGTSTRVAAVWNRDGRNWRILSGMSAEEIRKEDARNRAGRGSPEAAPSDDVGRGSPDPAQGTDRAGRGSPDPAQGTDRRSPFSRPAAESGRPSVPERAGSGDPRPALRSGDPRPTSPKFLPIDVAGYVTSAGGQPADRYAALWFEKSGDDDARLYVGTTADEQDEIQDKLKDAKLIPRTLNAMIGADRGEKYCGVWGKPPGVAVTGQTSRDQFEGNFEQSLAHLSAQLLIDLAVSGASKPQPTRERAQADLQRAEKKLKTKPGDLDARLAKAMAMLRLGENQKALDDFQVVVGNNPEDAFAKQYRVIALARLGKKQDAKSELEKFQKGDAPERSKLYLASAVAAELGEGADQAFESLEAAIKKRLKDADLRYDGARAFSLASKAISRSDKAKGRQRAERSFQWLREAVKDDDADFGKIDGDADFDPIRDDPAFAEIMKAGHPERRYAAVSGSDATAFESTSIYGLAPDAHLRKCRDLIAQGYRPVSWSASQTATLGPLVTASVWHRPTVGEEIKDRLAERQARAAVALVRLGKAGSVWPLLRHSPDPRLRSFILNWLSPLGADPHAVAAELDRLDSSPRPAERGEGGRRPGEGSSVPAAAMDAILFHPETSQRRALILALGSYGTDGLSPGEREPLIGRLLDLYRNDPDSGIHGAVEWTLRKWGQQEKLKELDAQLIKVKDRGDRRWFVNSQGQTFAVIAGPVEFRMGSPPTEPKRNVTTETPRRVVIPRRFAIAAKEVTVEQWLRFERTHSGLELSPAFVNQHSPGPDGPMIGFNWYTAAEYCNWLSEQEGLPKDQWCYLPNKAGAYAEGMTIPADVLERTGYRLPTEPESEFACRSGTVTSYYFGLSNALLDRYAWYQANSKEHAWSCGSLLPNDLGLFDMLGNEFEWIQDSTRRPIPEKKGTMSDIILISEIVNDRSPRLLRGGAFNYPSASVRSASRNWNAATNRFSNFGFRPARTYP